MKLLIAIPALNEEAAIAGIIERCLAARDTIVKRSPVTAVDITVVSDGSTDRTVDIARRYADRIRLVVFEKNRGYGAAIKAAWSESDADILGFLDADGTCDPEFFAALCTKLEEEHADVVLGGRLNARSRMPRLRRLGNVLFAGMLSILSSRRVNDTASGMRVVRASRLPDLMPLPDGMHFTPAMSARALLDERLRIVEVPMPYHERQGRSKLRVVADGVRFLRVILQTGFLYRPSRPLAILALAFAATALGLMVRPAIHYLEHRALLEWMIYRFVVSSLLATVACLLVSASYLAGRVVTLTLTGRHPGHAPRLQAVFRSRLFWVVPGALLLAGGALVLRSLLDLIATGHTDEHWSRFVVMSFCYQVAGILVVTKALDYILGLIALQLDYLKGVADGRGAGARDPEAP